MLHILIQSTLLLAPQAETASAAAPVTEPEVPASELVAPQEDRGWFADWSGSFDVGLTLIGGNSESSTGTANLGLGWERALDAVALGATYSSNRTTDKATGVATTTSRLYQYDAEYNRFFTEEKDFYGYASGDLRQDEPNGLQARTAGGIGLGYRLNPFENTELNLEGGASYVTENKVGTLTETSGVGRAAYDFTTTFSEDLALTGAGVYLNGGDIETYIQDLGLTWNLNGSWYLRAAVNVAYDANPSAGFGTTDRRYDLVIGTTF